MSIQAFFNQQATIKSRTGYDQYGKETQGTGTVAYCRFQNKVSTRLNADGSVETVEGKLFFDPATAVSQGDHIVYGGVDYRVLDVNTVVDGHGNTHHLETRLAKWQS